MPDHVIKAITGIPNEIYKEGREYVGPPIARGKDTHENYKKMVMEAKKLYAMRNDVLIKIDRETEKEATDVCRMWIEEVNELEKDVNGLKSEFSTVKDKSIFQLAHFSEQLRKKYDELHSCCQEESKLELFRERPPSPVIIITKAPKIEDKPSIHGVYEKIIRHLEDKNVKRIGLWGKMGVGKTAIMENLNNRKQIAEDFAIVIFATLPDEENRSKEELELAIEKLRRKIAVRLKLNIEGKTNDEITSKISDQLENKKSYLFLLDNVWGKFELDEIGINCENHNHGKVVLASRDRDICRFMGVDENMEVKPLEHNEAVNLFREKLGEKANHSEFQKIATLVVRHCSNLPLLIDKVAGFFRMKETTLWRSCLIEFQKWPYVEISGLNEVFRLLRFCFEKLDAEDKKRCFLYSALHTEDSEIYTNYLVQCCFAECFVEGLDRGLLIVDDLIEAYLLEKGKKKSHVKMSTVLRNMALKIVPEWKDLKFLVRAGKGLKVPPSDEEWKEAKQISLMDNQLGTLPGKPDCSNLSTLLLQRNAALTEIPNQFFEYMKNLQVLDLHGTNIKTLPSLSCLTSLKALYLSPCRQLMKLPSDIDALKLLEFLDIRGTKIYCLPTKIGCLSKLRCLRVSFSEFDGQPGEAEQHDDVISKLFLLEELVIEVEGHNRWWNYVAKDISEQVAELENLSSLSFCFPDVNCLETFVTKISLGNKGSFSFQFSVNFHYSTRHEILDYFDNDFCRCLKYKGDEGIDQVILNLLAETNKFELIDHKGALTLLDFGIENINKLQGCLIGGCREIKTIIDASGITDGVLQCMEKIYVKNMLELLSIWEGPVPPGSLANLTILDISKCPNLKKIFSSSMIQQLCKLQSLEVKECHGIEESLIESENDGTNEPNVLPSLTTIVLHDLAELKSIWEKKVKCPSVTSFKVTECPKLLDYTI